MNVEVRHATYDDTIAVLSHSSVKDHPEARMHLRSYFRRSSDVWVGVGDGVVVCAWGLIPPTLMSDRAYIWLINHEDMGKYKFVFIRQSQLWMEKALKSYKIIWGHTLPNNERAVKWLKWLGAKFEPEEDGKLRFEIRSA